jgi:hypothetical protein
VYTRLPRSRDPELWANRIERGLVRITSATRLEMGYSARSVADLRSEVTSPPLVRRKSPDVMGFAPFHLGRISPIGPNSD